MLEGSKALMARPLKKSFICGFPYLLLNGYELRFVCVVTVLHRLVGALQHWILPKHNLEKIEILNCSFRCEHKIFSQSLKRSQAVMKIEDAPGHPRHDFIAVPQPPGYI